MRVYIGADSATGLFGRLRFLSPDPFVDSYGLCGQLRLLRTSSYDFRKPELSQFVWDFRDAFLAFVRNRGTST